MNSLRLILLQILATTAQNADLPTLYEYYTTDGINSGLSVDQPFFTLNAKNISIYSGAMHYFRIPKPYWRDRLRKLRAAGLNTVETYIAWNLHEPLEGKFDFGAGGSDMEEFLDFKEYLKIAQEEDLLAIVRVGPYICAEWEWGGLPSYLLKNPNITVRTSDEIFMRHVRRYFDQMVPLLVDLQFTLGGPIIALQVENEYGSSFDIDKGYVQDLVDLLRGKGIIELLVSSDSIWTAQRGTLPGVLFQTVNFGTLPDLQFDVLQIMQPDQPIMGMEFWTGWYDHWSEEHNVVDNETFRDLFETILKYPASVNMYMFLGGTNWGFFNGANVGLSGNIHFEPVTTSYDYDAPLTEAGDYSDKYEIVKELIGKYNPVKTLTPDPPELVPRKSYETITITDQVEYQDLVDKIAEVVFNLSPLYMEELPINDNSGQSFGYIIYRKDGIDIPANSTLTIQGNIRDTLLVIVNGDLVSTPLQNIEDLDGFGYWRMEESSITLPMELINATLDLVVENWGRGNFGNIYRQRKGLGSDNKILLNDQEITSWLHFPLEFKKDWTLGLKNWRRGSTERAPALFRAVLRIDEEVLDTYMDMGGWTKGTVIVNGFVLGKYAVIGPQQSLYLPAPFLRRGDNEILVFEHFKPAGEIRFSADPRFGNV